MFFHRLLRCRIAAELSWSTSASILGCRGCYALSLSLAVMESGWDHSLIGTLSEELVWLNFTLVQVSILPCLLSFCLCRYCPLTVNSYTKHSFVEICCTAVDVFALILVCRTALHYLHVRVIKKHGVQSRTCPKQVKMRSLFVILRSWWLYLLFSSACMHAVLHM